LASEGVRVLAVAYGRWPAEIPLPDDVAAMKLTWSGLMGFADPLRPSVPGSITACRNAGVRVVMITGDHPGTALSIARQSGLTADRVITGPEFDRLDSNELLQTARTVDVYARFRPEQKLRLVEALEADGQVVAMTGDGINDAPALKAAHIGIAMGSRGTDVAREAAALVLLDDDFASLVRGIALGRRIYDNIGKAVGYVIAIHVAIAGAALLPILLGAPLILTPMLIALMELLIDPACSVIFEAEPADPDVMRRPPRPRGASLMNRRLVIGSLTQGVAALVCVGGVYLWYAGQGAEPDFTRTVTLLTLLLANAALVLEHRSGTAAPRAGKTERNPALLWGAAIAIPLLSLLFLVPAGRSLLQLSAIGLRDVAICFISATLLWLGLHIIRRTFAR
jgi:P-type Ca2+ transporter type 2C